MTRLRTLLLLLALMLAVPAAALAYEPYAETDFVAITSATSAILGGFVDDGGERTDALFKWDLGESDFCSNEDGTAASAFQSDPAHIEPDPANLDGWDVTADVTGLTAGSWYCFVLMATNPSGTSDGGFGFFMAGAPDAYTDDVSVTGADTASVTGAVYPAGQTATYYAEWDDAGSEWCLSDGSAETPAHATDPATLAYADSTYHDVTVNVTGLVPGGEYCVQIVGQNGVSRAGGGLVWFVAGYPHAFTDDIQETSATSGRVSGSVNPAGQQTTYRVAYDVASSEWCSNYGHTGTPAGSTDPIPLDAADSGWHDVTVDVSGLAAGTGYCAELVAHNGSGDAHGGVSFFTPGHAHATIGTAKATGADTAAVTGSVNPAAQTATYKVNYDVSGSTWCQSSGGESSPANNTATATLPHTDDASHDVTVELIGLTPGQSYCVQLVAHNGLGDVSGGFATFRAGLPVVTMSAPQVSGTSSELLQGSVNPSNQATTYYYQYSQAGSEFCDSGGKSGESTAAQSHPVVPADASAHPVDDLLEGLAQGTVYCIRLVAWNEAGLAATDTVEFAIYPPEAFTQPASRVGIYRATLNAVIGPRGHATSHRFEYAPVSSAFCASGGASGGRMFTPERTATGTEPRSVAAVIAYLDPATTYCYLVSASSIAGASRGALGTFRTAPLPPAAVITPAKVRRITKDGSFTAGTLRCTSPSRCDALVKVKGAKRQLAIWRFRPKPGRTIALWLMLNEPARVALVKAKTLTPTVTVKVTSTGALPVTKQFPLTLKAPLK
jgi:hypothetical protein